MQNILNNSNEILHNLLKSIPVKNRADLLKILQKDVETRAKKTTQRKFNKVF